MVRLAMVKATKILRLVQRVVMGLALTHVLLARTELEQLVMAKAKQTRKLVPLVVIV